MKPAIELMAMTEEEVILNASDPFASELEDENPIDTEKMLIREMDNNPLGFIFDFE